MTSEDGNWQIRAELAVNDTTPLFEGLHVAAHADDERGTTLNHSAPLPVPTWRQPPTLLEPRWRTPLILAPGS